MVCLDIRQYFENRLKLKLLSFDIYHINNSSFLIKKQLQPIQLKLFDYLGLCVSLKIKSAPEAKHLILKYL